MLHLPFCDFEGSGIFNEGKETSAMSFPSKVMEKSGPEPVKAEL
jgi:hypothetical protein